MDNFVTEMQTSYNTSMENLEGLSANMTNFLEMAEECQSDDIWSFVGCIAEVSERVFHECVQQSSTSFPRKRLRSPGK